MVELNEILEDENVNFKLIPYTIVGIFKHLMSTEIEKHSLDKILLLSVLVCLKPSIEESVYTVESIVKYFNSIFEKKTVNIFRYKYEELFDELDFNLLEDCVLAACLLTMILISKCDNPNITSKTIEEVLLDEYYNIKELVDKALYDRLFYQDEFKIRMMSPLMINSLGINLSRIKTVLSEEDIENYKEFDFINFEIDPLGNGFDSKIICEFISEIATEKFIDEEHDEFINQIHQNKVNIKNNILSLDPTLNENTVKKIDVSKYDDSIFHLAHFYLYGIFVEQNYEKSFNLFKKLSSLGNGDASYMISKFYGKALYVNFDAKEHSRYLTLAVSQGSQFAIKYLNEIFYLYRKKKYINDGMGYNSSLLSVNDYMKKKAELINSNNISDWEFVNTSISQKVIEKRIVNKYNNLCLSLLNEKTDKFISKFKKYAKNYDDSLMKLICEEKRINEKKLLIEILNNISNDVLELETAKKIVLSLTSVAKHELPNLGPHIRYSLDYDSIRKTEHNEAIMCWYFATIELGDNTYLKEAFEFFDNGDCAKNVYTDEFFMKIAKKHHDFDMLKSYNLTSVSKLRELVDYGFKFANCVVIDIYVKNNDFEAANNKLRQLLYQCDNIEKHKLVNNPYKYFECSKNTNIIECIKYPAGNITLKKNQAPTHRKEGCYIATCVYGSYDCPSVWVLRRYRDNYLKNSVLGRLFIKIYYFISPKIIKIFGNKTWFKKPIKSILDKKVMKLRTKGYKDEPYKDYFN